MPFDQRKNAGDGAGMPRLLVGQVGQVELGDDGELVAGAVVFVEEGVGFGGVVARPCERHLRRGFRRASRSRYYLSR